MNTFAIGSLPVHFSVAKLFTFRWQYTIDKLIALKQQKIETLKEYKKSLIFECVTGKKDIY